MNFEAHLSDAAMDELVERVADRVLERLGGVAAAEPASEFLTVDEAAAVLRSSRQRVYDLLSDGRLTRHKDGSRVLISRAELVAHLCPNGARHRMGSGVAR